MEIESSKENKIDIKQDTLPEGTLPIMEHFLTLQGEGAHSGKAAYFIRLAGCDVGCVWCDVKESWEAYEDQLTPIDDLIKVVADQNCRLVVITGGEPLMYDLTELTTKLKAIGCQIHIETSGAYPISGILDWVCLSPKKFKHPVDHIYLRAHELKVVIYNHKDFEWAEQEASRVVKNCSLFLQPEWSKEEKMLPLIVDYIKENPKWQLSLQTHKYLEIP